MWASGGSRRLSKLEDQISSLPGLHTSLSFASCATASLCKVVSTTPSSPPFYISVHLRRLRCRTVRPDTATSRVKRRKHEKLASYSCQWWAYQGRSGYQVHVHAMEIWISYLGWLSKLFIGLRVAYLHQPSFQARSSYNHAHELDSANRQSKRPKRIQEIFTRVKQCSLRRTQQSVALRLHLSTNFQIEFSPITLLLLSSLPPLAAFIAQLSAACAFHPCPTLP